MTTTRKITFDPVTPEASQDTAAGASQNRETALVNGVKYVIAGKLNEASVIQRPNGSKLYLALPVNDGKDGIYGANRYRIVRPLTHGESFDGAHSKPANAQAASVHTPGPWTYGEDDNNILAGRGGIYGKLVIAEVNIDGAIIREAEGQANGYLIAAAPETAAERDSLQQSLTRLQMAVMHGQRWGQALDENDRLKIQLNQILEAYEDCQILRDQAREQVKTLIKACKLSMHAIAGLSFIDHQEVVPAWDALKAAIASAESEQAK